jgi:hypothetical protein
MRRWLPRIHTSPVLLVGCLGGSGISSASVRPAVFWMPKSFGSSMPQSVRAFGAPLHQLIEVPIPEAHVVLDHELAAFLHRPVVGDEHGHSLHTELGQGLQSLVATQHHVAVAIGDDHQGARLQHFGELLQALLQLAELLIAHHARVLWVRVYAPDRHVLDLHAAKLCEGDLLVGLGMSRPKVSIAHCLICSM